MGSSGGCAIDAEEVGVEICAFEAVVPAGEDSAVREASISKAHQMVWFSVLTRAPTSSISLLPWLWRGNSRHERYDMTLR